MKSFLKKRLPGKLLGLHHVSHRTALDQWGWHASLKNGFSCDEQGNPIPWMSYAAIALLNSRARPSWDIFEFGGGYSTIWWGQRTAPSPPSSTTPSGAPASLPCSPPTANSSTPLSAEPPPKPPTNRANPTNLIVVDGRKRVKCALNSVEALTPEGVIVWEDTDRPYYAPGLHHSPPSASNNSTSSA